METLDTLLHRPEALDAVLLRYRGAPAADVANLRLDAVSGARRAANGALALERVEYLQYAPAKLTLTPPKACHVGRPR